MKQNKSLIITFLILLVSAALYRLIPARPAGFAPQVALALFGGAVIKNKTWAIALTIGSLFLGDLLFQLLFATNVSPNWGFYDGQWAIYLSYMLVTVLGFFMRKINVSSVLIYSVAGSLIYFLLSNFITWKTGYGFARPQTFTGLMQCYGDAIAFYRNGLIHGFALNFILQDVLWGAVFFGGYYLLNRPAAMQPAKA